MSASAPDDDQCSYFSAKCRLLMIDLVIAFVLFIFCLYCCVFLRCYRFSLNTIFLSVTENKSSDRKLSLIPFVSAACSVSNTHLIPYIGTGINAIPDPPSPLYITTVFRALKRSRDPDCRPFADILSSILNLESLFPPFTKI